MHLHPSDIHGLSRLAITATTRITDLVETMHATVTALPQLRPAATDRRTRGVTGFVYGNVRAITHLVGGVIDLALAPFVTLLDAPATTAERDAVIAALNGVVGDHLAATQNPLAIQPALRRHDAAPATGKVVVLVHGLYMHDRQWQRNGHDHGAALARDLGFTPLYAHYNSGQHISTNGRILAALLETTLASWPQPIDELVIIGHSMGGLVARSACHYAAAAGHAWPQLLRKLVFLGAPHHGSPWERGGNWIDIGLGMISYTAPFARLGKLRSAGITDLRHGSLRDEDWIAHDRFAHNHDTRCPLPLPDGVRCYAIAAALDETEAGYVSNLIGDGLVPLGSAHGVHAAEERHLGIPDAQRWTGYNMHHLDLLERPTVYAQLRAWLENCPMDRADLLAQWRREEAHPFSGWDFSYLDGRMIEEPPPWDYMARAAELMQRASSVVDLDTGGGERFLELRPHWPAKVVATEEYPPNLALAKQRLAPLGVQVLSVRITDDDPLPFADGEFDLVLNRHSAFNAAEIGRVLAPGGVFLTQQVHGLWADDLHAAFDVTPQWPNATPEQYVPRLQAAGLTVTDVQNWQGALRFTDVGAIVYFLKAAPWTVPGFTVDTHAGYLFALQARLDAGESLLFTARTYLIEAHKT